MGAYLPESIFGVGIYSREALNQRRGLNRIIKVAGSVSIIITSLQLGKTKREGNGFC